MALGDVIKRQRETIGVSQEWLGRMTGLSKNTIYLYEKNKRKPTTENLKKIANMLGTTVSFLVGETQNPKPQFGTDKDMSKKEQLKYGMTSIIDQTNMTYSDIFTAAKELFKENDLNAYNEEFESLESNASKVDSVAFIPVIDGIVSVSAGNGNGYPQIEWSKSGEMPIPRSELSGYAWQGAQFHIITVDGESMEPFISDGDKLLFAEGIEVGPGEVAVVSYNDALLVKGVLRNNDGTVTLISFNKRFGDRIIDPEQHSFRVLGKALRVVSSRKIPGTI